MNLRISTYRNYVGREDDPTCDKHFQNPGHKFCENAKFMIIEIMNNASLPKQERRSFLKHRENF